ncbi:MAG: hypothetical protein D3923_18985, partial [Candidatus Electrothrix sp. AR3]|nr:hypothetical protein [Candidatus Electrothrix sp. AR3]
MNPQPENKKSFSLKQVLALGLGVMLLTITATVVAIKIWFFPQPFKPVLLDAQEEQQLEQKLDRLASQTREKKSLPDFNEAGGLHPEAYT